MESTESYGLLEDAFGSGGTPRITRAPGRVNLIGEHTDYNDGYVLPFAIDRVIEVAFMPRRDNKVCATSAAFEDIVEFELPIAEASPTGQWFDYLIGILLELSRFVDYPHGFEVAVTSTIPLGAGLSSSAALEIALALGLVRLYETPLNDLELIQLCHRAENAFVGAKCGIMDQYVSLLARDRCALFLDVGSLIHQHVHVGFADATFLVVNSSVRRVLAHSGYNKRRRECEQALRWLDENLPGRPLHSLSQITEGDLRCVKDGMPELLHRRAQHVVSENNRVKQATRALKEGQSATVGELLFASHASLRDLYEVSTPELDFLVDWGRQHGAFGARLIGGGFGGATLHLVPSNESDAYSREILVAYEQQFEKQGSVWEVRPSPGAKALSEEEQ